MDTLPLEILVHIFTFVGDRPILSVVSRMWRDAYVISKRQINKPMTYVESIVESYECATEYYHRRWSEHGRASRHFANVIHNKPLMWQPKFDDRITSKFGLSQGSTIFPDDVRAFLGVWPGVETTQNTRIIFAAKGDLPSLIHATELEKGVRSQLKVDRVAAEHGHIHILEWCESINDLISNNTLVAAAKRGQIATVAWLHDRGCQLTSEAIYFAIVNGQFDMVKWLCTHNGLVDEPLLAAIIRLGYIDMFKWLVLQGYTRNKWMVFEPEFASRLDMIKWLYDQNQESRIMLKGCLDKVPRHIITWIREHNPPGHVV